MDEAFLIWRLIIVLEFVKSLVNSIMKKQKKKEDVVGKINLKKKKKRRTNQSNYVCSWN